MPRRKAAYIKRLQNLRKKANAPKKEQEDSPKSLGARIKLENPILPAEHSSLGARIKLENAILPAEHSSLDARKKLVDSLNESFPTATIDSGKECVVPVALLEQLSEAAPVCMTCLEPFVVESVVTHIVPKVTRECGCGKQTIFNAPRAKTLDGSKTSFKMQDLSIVHSTMLNSDGFAGMGRLTTNLVMPGFAKSSYYKHAAFLHNQMRHHYLRLQQQAVSAVELYYQLEEDYSGSKLLDIAVTFDATQMTGGYRSHICVCFVTECNTGFVVDFEVLSNLCVMCAQKKTALSSEAFSEWERKHRPRCKRNFEGESDAMKEEGAVRLWSRSKTLGLRYVSFVSNGNSAAYNAVVTSDPYSFPIEKEEGRDRVVQGLSLQSKLWLKCTKEKSVSLDRVLYAARATVLEHNFGFANASLLRSLRGTSSTMLEGLQAQERRVAPSRKRKLRDLDHDPEVADHAEPESSFSSSSISFDLLALQ